MSVKLCLSLGGKNTVRMCDNKLLRRIFEIRREEMTGEWREFT
jgi:hypothetical protein